MKPIMTEHFVFNKEDNGGESLMASIEFYDNGDAAHGYPDGIYTVQKLTLMSYSNMATFTLSNVFTPQNLRELADLIEKGYTTAEKKVWKTQIDEKANL